MYQVEALLNTVCELLIKISYQHSAYKHQVGLLAIDPLLYLMEPPKSSEAAKVTK